MKPKLIIILAILVLAPVALLAWVSLRAVRGEQAMLRRKFEQLHTRKLQDIDERIAQLVQERGRALQVLILDLTPTPKALRNQTRTNPVIEQMFALSADGRLIHPRPSGALSIAERDFLTRTSRIWLDKSLVQAKRRGETSPPTGTVPLSSSASAAPEDPEDPEAPIPQDHGWHTYYWGSGLRVLFWQRDSTGRVVGAELTRARLLADIIELLPDSNPANPSLPDGRIALVDSQGKVIYQWGRYAPATDEQPQVGIPLQEPLSAWRLQYFPDAASLENGLGRGAVFSLLSGLGAVGLALVGLAVYFYRESAREIRAAAQRVNFVNQVSHELKTPLTNIRLYAELLAGAVDESDEKARRHLDVIVAEAQRLSRLIGNVLTFARKRRGAVALHLKPGVVDESIRSVLDQFAPSLEAAGLTYTFDSGASRPVLFDADAVEQILGNLVNNVEKYAATGKSFEITSRQEGDMTTVSVTDRGPGVSAGARERIFLPFVRLSDKLSDGVTGTGIGLSIARELARLHGGELELAPVEAGARFTLTLRTQAPEDAS